jgi:predicted ABC-type ATPase
VNAPARVKQPRVVVIAGPNGSGKSTLTRALRRRGIIPRLYINADDIAREVTPPAGVAADVAAFYEAERRRQAYFEARSDFAFETVFSHPSKVLLLERMVTIFYLTTRDPDINVERVRQRMREGGHAVPEERIISRYWRCQQLFSRVIETADEAYVFDASTRRSTLAFKRAGDTLVVQSVANWAEARLLSPLSEREAERTAIATEFGGRRKRLTLPDELDGSYSGLFRHVGSHYAVQQLARAWMRHDLALFQGELAIPRDQPATVAYHQGWWQIETGCKPG